MIDDVTYTHPYGLYDSVMRDALKAAVRGVGSSHKRTLLKEGKGPMQEFRKKIHVLFGVWQVDW